MPRRARWPSIGRRAYGAAQPQRDLLALRALARQPLRRLVAIHPDWASAWRVGDTSTVDALAKLELRSLGLNASFAIADRARSAGAVGR